LSPSKDLCQKNFNFINLRKVQQEELHLLLQNTFTAVHKVFVSSGDNTLNYYTDLKKELFLWEEELRRSAMVDAVNSKLDQLLISTLGNLTTSSTTSFLKSIAWAVTSRFRHDHLKKNNKDELSKNNFSNLFNLLNKDLVLEELVSNNNELAVQCRQILAGSLVCCSNIGTPKSKFFEDMGFKKEIKYRWDKLLFKYTDYEQWTYNQGFYHLLFIESFRYCLNQSVLLVSGLMDTYYTLKDIILTDVEINFMLEKYFSLSVRDELVEWFKYHSNFLFATINSDSELPIEPSFNEDAAGFLCGSRIFRLNRKLLYEKTPENIGFFYTIMDCKRSFPELSLSREHISKEKHRDNLTGKNRRKTMKENGICLREEGNYITDLKESITSVVDSVFSTIREEKLIFRLPTNNSCYENARSKGGNLGSLFSLKLLGVSDTSEDFLPCEVDQILERTRNQVNTFPITGKIPNLDCVHGDMSYIHENERLGPLFNWDPFPLKECLADCIKEIKGRYYTTDNERRSKIRLQSNKKIGQHRKIWTNRYLTVAKVATIGEPMKFRIVTSGNMSEYNIGRMMQRPLWEQLHSHPVFTLSGSPITVDYIMDRVRGVVGGKFVAGDYSNATDCLDHRLRDWAWKEICRKTGLSKLSPEDIIKSSRYSNYFQDNNLIKASYNISLNPMLKYFKTGEEIGYLDYCTQPDKWTYEEYGRLTLENHRIESSAGNFKQSEGQLMGSPLSFILLCIVNAAICYTAYKVYWTNHIMSATMKTFAEYANHYCLIINGDDLSFWIPNGEDGLYLYWKRAAFVAGMSPSIGKNFISKNMILINSTPLWYEGGIVTPIIRLNPGLLRGEGKVKFDSRTDNDDTLDEVLLSKGDQLEKVLEQCQGRGKEKVYAIFKFYNLPLLKKSNRSWFLPRSLGGLGLPFGDVTNHARNLANGILKGLYEPSIEKSSAFNMKESRSIWERFYLKKYLRLNRKDNFFDKGYINGFGDWDQIGTTCLFEKEEGLDYFFKDHIDYEYLIPTILVPDFTLSLKSEYLKNANDAIKHPYLNTERNWTGFKPSFLYGGYYYETPKCTNLIEETVTDWQLADYQIDLPEIFLIIQNKLNSLLLQNEMQKCEQFDIESSSQLVR
jgi:hypothetical protein